ncbi:MAG: glycosyltransferase family 1 protein, partial [Pseudomonadota bacterium]
MADTLDALVVFGEDWGAHPSSTQHLMTQLQDRYAIAWFNSLGLRRPRLSGADLQRVWRKGAAMMRPANATKAQNGAPAAPFPVIAPRVIPWPGAELADAFNGRALAAQINAARRSHNLERMAIWTSLPTAMPALRYFPEAPVIYYCGDDFGALAGVDHGPVSRLEARLAERADLILTASQVLAHRFAPQKTHVVSHGFHADRFSEPAARAPELDAVPPGPIAGFYGALEAWIDVAALHRAATILTEWQFVLIGPVRTDVRRLETLPNVHLLGPKPHERLAQFSQHWDVSLLPFRDCDQITACNPLKLREYLAAGTPIAAAIPFPALAPYRALVACADGHTFSDAIVAAAGDAARNGARRQAVEGESWADRAATVAELIAA